MRLSLSDRESHDLSPCSHISERRLMAGCYCIVLRAPRTILERVSHSLLSAGGINNKKEASVKERRALKAFRSCFHG